jgi:hypothetical protein
MSSDTNTSIAYNTGQITHEYTVPQKKTLIQFQLIISKKHK